MDGINQRTRICQDVSVFGSSPDTYAWRNGVHIDSDTNGTFLDYTATALNQYTLASGVTLPIGGGGSPPVRPAYDGDGNYQHGPLPVDQASNALLDWDAENRLIRITKSNGDLIEYQYDHLSRRIARTITPAGGTGSVTRFLYDGWNPIAEYIDVTLHKTYTWGLDLSGSGNISKEECQKRRMNCLQEIHNLSQLQS